MKAPKKVKVTAGGEKHVVYKKTTKKGEGKVGNIMVNHPTKDKGQWDTIDLTAKGKAKTVAQGVAATKKWHKDNPDYEYKGKGMAKSRAQQAAIAISMKKAGKKPKSLPKAQTGAAKKNIKYAPLTSMPNPNWKYDMDKKFSSQPDTVKLKTDKPLKFDKQGNIQYKKGGSTPAWTRKEGKNPEGGLNAKGVASYRAANPGSKLQTAVTTKPSKLKAGSKDAKRRKSFCARMSGMPGPMKDEKGRPTRKALSLRKWNC